MPEPAPIKLPANAYTPLPPGTVYSPPIAASEHISSLHGIVSSSGARVCRASNPGNARRSTTARGVDARAFGGESGALEFVAGAGLPVICHTPRNRRCRQWRGPKWAPQREHWGRATVSSAARETECAGRCAMLRVGTGVKNEARRLAWPLAAGRLNGNSPEGAPSEDWLLHAGFSRALAGGTALTTGVKDEASRTPGVGRRKRLPHYVARNRRAGFSWPFAGGTANTTEKPVTRFWWRGPVGGARGALEFPGGAGLGVQVGKALAEVLVGAEEERLDGRDGAAHGARHLAIVQLLILVHEDRRAVVGGQFLNCRADFG